jgi:hypothetical protein
VNPPLERQLPKQGVPNRSRPTKSASAATDNFWAAGKKYAPEFWRDIRNSFDKKSLDAVRTWDAGSACDLWTWLYLSKAFDYWTLAQLCAIAPYLAKLGPESWLEATLDVVALGKGKVTVKAVQALARAVKEIRVLRRLYDTATVVEKLTPVLSTPYGRLTRQLLGKGWRALRQDWTKQADVLLEIQTIPGPDANLQSPTKISTRSRPGTPKPTKFKPEIVTHSPAFLKYGFGMPTGRTDPFPRELQNVAPHLRQDFLRDYYGANPLAAQTASREARRIIDWADQKLRQSFRVPTGRWEPFPRERLGIPIHQRQNWLRNYYAANPMAAARARSEARTITDWAHKVLR